jgi:hypothetical protein
VIVGAEDLPGPWPIYLFAAYWERLCASAGASFLR